MTSCCPGVPVPAYIGYYLFVLPCLRRLLGSKDPRSAAIQVRVRVFVAFDKNIVV